MQRKDEDLGVLPDTSLDPSQRFTLWLQNHGPFVCQMLLPGGPIEVNKAPCPLTYPLGSISRLLRGDRHLQLVVTAEHQKACPPPSAPHTEESPPAKPPRLCSSITALPLDKASSLRAGIPAFLQFIFLQPPVVFTNANPIN